MTCKYKECPSSDDGKHCYHLQEWNNTAYKCCHCGRIEYQNTGRPNGTTYPSPIWIVPTIPTTTPYYPGVTYFTCNAS
jgi:hypothetical protein